MSKPYIPDASKKSDKKRPGFIHPNTPPRLVAKYKRCGYVMRKLAEEIGVNMFYVHRLITHGEEPTDRTERGRFTRQKLYLPRRRKKKAPRQPLPDYLQWWKQQDRRTIIKQLYELSNKEQR